jgi:RNA polymerase sigma-70 factor (sigma-E family)
VTATHGFTAWATARYAGLLHAALLISGDPQAAQDLVQSSLAKTQVAWRRVRENPDAYVRRVMVTTNTDVWRRQPWREQSSAAMVDRPAEASGFGVVDDRDELLRALQRLTRKQRAIVVLRHYVQLSEEETAAVLGCSVGTVKSTASRALAHLRADLTDASKELC